MNNFLTIARMVRIMQTTKSRSLISWAEAEGKRALLIETTLNPVK